MGIMRPRIVKSGTDFRDLSSMDVEVVASPEGSVRRMVVKSLKGSRVLGFLVRSLFSSISTSRQATHHPTGNASF